MTKRDLSDEGIARARGRGAEKIITRLVRGPPLTITISEEDAKKWGFPDAETMRVTLAVFADALPENIKPLLTIRDGVKK